MAVSFLRARTYFRYFFAPVKRELSEILAPTLALRLIVCGVTGLVVKGGLANVGRS